MKKKPFLISVVGQTSTGKSDFAVLLALEFKKIGITAEIISADSRQVYTGLDLLSGKITEKEMRSIPHHLLNVCNPKKIFSVSDYLKHGTNVIDKIISKGNLPIVVGGTGFYIDALLNGVVLPEVKPNKIFRKSLEKLSTQELYQILKKQDTTRAKNIDKNNRVRLIRALEINEEIGKVPKLKSKRIYNTFKIGLTTEDEILKARILNRISKRLKQGMLNEAKKLHNNGLSYSRMESLGLESKYASYYLQKKITKQEFIEQLSAETFKFAKRQKTWFKRDAEIDWITI